MNEAQWLAGALLVGLLCAGVAPPEHATLVSGAGVNAFDEWLVVRGGWVRGADGGNGLSVLVGD